MKYVVTVQMTETHRVEIEADSWVHARAQVQVTIDHAGPLEFAEKFDNPERIDWRVCGVGYVSPASPDGSKPDCGEAGSWRRSTHQRRRGDDSRWSSYMMPEIPNYTLLPGHIRSRVQLYIERGHSVGGFLRAVICNDLKGAMGRADEINRERLHDIVRFFYNEVPGDSWGSHEKMVAWVEHNGMQRWQSYPETITTTTAKYVSPPDYGKGLQLAQEYSKP